MLFGDYLVQQKIISEQQLLEGLLEQLERTPSYAMACYQAKLLDAGQLLNVLKRQQLDSSDFFSAARALNAWPEEKTAQLIDVLRRQRLPLGEILVEKGALALKDLTRHLDEYLANTSIPSSPSQPSREILEPMFNMTRHLGQLSADEGFLFDSMTIQIADQLDVLSGSLQSSEQTERSVICGKMALLFRKVQSDGFESTLEHLNSFSTRAIELFEMLFERQDGADSDLQGAFDSLGASLAS